MFTVIVTEKGGDQKRLDFDKPEITIGRVQGNDIILPKGNVSKRHSRIVLKDGKFIIVDLKSTNGTYVNGRKITSPLVIKDTDKIYIGDFIITLEEPNGASAGLGAGLGASAPPLPGPPGLGAPPAPPRKAPLPPAPAMDAAGDDDDDDLPSPPAPEPVAPPPPRVAPPPPRGTGSLGQPALGAAPLPPPSPRSSGGTMPPPMRDPLAARPASAVPSNGPLASPATAPRPSISEPPPAPLREPGAGVSVPPTPPGTRRTAGMGAAVPPPPTPSGPGTAPPARLVGAGAPAVEPAAPPTPPSPPPAATPAPAIVPTVVPPPPQVVAPPAPIVAPPQVVPIVAQPIPVAQPPDPRRDKALELQREVSGKLVAQLDLERVPVERLADEALWQRAERVIVELVEQMDSADQIPSFVDHDALIKDTLNETLGLGPLEDLLADDGVVSIIVNRHDRLLIEKGGRLEHSDKVFSSENALRQVVTRLTVPLGIRSESPLVDVRLPDGARLTAVLAPAAARGPTLVLRKPRQGTIGLDDLVRASVLSKGMADFLAVAVNARKNVLVCGGAGAQKAMLLSALAGAAGAGERIVSVEDVAELTIGRDGWIPLEARAPDVGTAQLLTAARALRPDRLVVGEVRGAEAFELLASIASAQDGSLLGAAGEGARPALQTLETLARLGAGAATTRALRELLVAGVHIVVHLARYADGVQRVAAISEVVGLRGEDVDVRELFHFQTQGRGPDGVIRGKFAGLGVIPHFYEALEARGVTADPSVFKS